MFGAMQRCVAFLWIDIWQIFTSSAVQDEYGRDIKNELSKIYPDNLNDEMPANRAGGKNAHS